MRFGGMPGIADVGLEQEKALSLLDGIYSTVVIRDILEREKRRGQKQITDPALLRKIILLIPLIYILPLFFGDKLFGVFVAEPIADILAASTTTVSFLIWAKKNLRDKAPQKQ